MLRHLIRFAFLLAILAAAALAGAALLERTEPVAVEWSGWILETQLWVIVVAGAVALIAGWVVIALLLGRELNLVHGKPEERLKAEDRLKDIQDAQPKGVAAQMVRDLVAKECGELSLVQLMECANRYADLTTDTNAKCYRRAQVVAFRQARRRVQGCPAAENGKCMGGSWVHDRLPIGKAPPHLLQSKEIDGEQATGEREPQRSGRGRPARADGILLSVGLLARWPRWPRWPRWRESCPIRVALLSLGVGWLRAGNERGHGKAPNRGLR